MVDKNLSLGTIFTGRVDKTFKNATRTLLKVTNDLVRSMNKLTGAMHGVSSASDKYSKKMDKAAAATGRIGKKADFAGKQIAKVRGAWERLTAAMKVTAAYGIASAVLYSMVMGVKAGIKEIVDFDQALKNLQAITRATDREVSSMGDVMKRVAADTKFSTGEIAEGMVLLGQAGFSATESLQAIQATANLATGTLSSMALTADLLTTAVRAFGLEAIESTRVADVMANAINRSKLTIDKLRIAFNFVGAAAAQTGLSIEQLAASMMILANHGLRASTIGTGLRQVLARLLAPNRKLREEFEAYGIALDKVNPRLVGFEQAMMRLSPILFDNKRKVVDMGKAYALFGLRGAQAAAVLVKAFLSTGAHSYGAMLEKVYEFDAAAKMAAKQAEGLGVKFKNLADRAKLMFIALGEAGLIDIMKGFVDVLRITTMAIATFLESAIGKAIVRFAAFSAAIYLVVKAVVILRKNFELLRIAAVFAYWALNPWIIALATVAAGFIYLYKRSDEAIKAIERQADKIKESTSALDLYAKTLGVLKTKHDEGKNVHLDYLNTLKHLIKAVPELRDQIKFTTKAWDDNAKAIEKVLRLKLKESIEINIGLINKYREAQKSSLFWNGIWISSINIAKKALDWWADGMLKIITFMPRLASKVIFKLIEWFSELSKAMAWIPGLGQFLDAMGKDLENLEQKITSYFENIGKGSKKFKEFEGKITESMKIMGVSLHGLGYSFEAIEKRLLALGASAEQVKKIIDDIKAMQWEFGKIEGPGKGISDKISTEALNLARRYQRMLVSMEDDTRNKINEIYKARLLDIQKWHKDRITNLKKTMKDIQAVEIIAAKERDILLAAAWEERDRKTLEFETLLEKERLDIKVINAKRALEVEKQNAKGRENIIKDIARKVMDLEVSTAENVLVIKKKYLDKIVEFYDIEHKKVRDAQKAVAQAELKLEKAKTKAVMVETVIRIRERRRELRDLLENMERTGEAYVAVLDEAYERDIINFSEYMDRRTAITEGWFDNFIYGLERSKKDSKSLGETMQDIGKKIKDVFADRLTDSLMDFMDGTKSAKEAFADFAKSMIKWLTEIIMKQMILNMLTGAMGMFGGGGGGVNAGQSFEGAWSGVFHKGGIIGATPAPVRMVNPNVFANAPRAHMGLAPDERPIIAKKDEGVFTPEQMAKLGGTHIETHVSIEDERLATKIQYGVEEKIREILREELR